MKIKRILFGVFVVLSLGLFIFQAPVVNALNRPDATKEKKGRVDNEFPLKGGRREETILQGLIAIQKAIAPSKKGYVAEDTAAEMQIATTAKEITAHNVKGDLDAFLTRLQQGAKARSEDIKDAIDTVVQRAGLNRIGKEHSQDVVVLPVSRISNMDMKDFNRFLVSPELAGKAVVVAANKKAQITEIREKFSEANDGRELAELVWLKVIPVLSLEPLESLFDQYALSVNCSLEKVTDKKLLDALAGGV